MKTKFHNIEDKEQRREIRSRALRELYDIESDMVYYESFPADFDPRDYRKGKLFPDNDVLVFELSAHVSIRMTTSLIEFVYQEYQPERLVVFTVSKLTWAQWLRKYLIDHEYNKFVRVIA